MNDKAFEAFWKANLHFRLKGVEALADGAVNHLKKLFKEAWDQGATEVVENSLFADPMMMIVKVQHERHAIAVHDGIKQYFIEPVKGRFDEMSVSFYDTVKVSDILDPEANIRRTTISVTKRGIHES